MENTKDKKYGIKYKVVRLSKDKYILIPISIEEGVKESLGFKTSKGIFPTLEEEKNLQTKYTMDHLYTIKELEELYEYGEDEEFLLDYFYEEQKDVVLYIEIDPKTKELKKREINLKAKEEDSEVMCSWVDDAPALQLNQRALEEILNCQSTSEMKELLEKYRSLLMSFQDAHEMKDITKVNIRNGKIESVETTRSVEHRGDFTPKKASLDIKLLPDKAGRERVGDVTYSGLKRYLKERIFGHDEEIETLAQILFMNYTAEEKEPVESILLVGPTGVGKTETVRASCQYLDIPYVEANASNLVPQGIKGMSLEDILSNLYENAGQDLLKAQRGLIFLDEFDKLNDSELDIKQSIKNILLTFTAGGTFPIDNDRFHFNFDSSMTNKIYAGVFDKIRERKKQMGFGTETSTNVKVLSEEELRKRIIEKAYFTQEELTRISTILEMKDLDRETKRQILLSSKTSEFLKKKNRYQRQFHMDIEADPSYIEAILDCLDQESTGMRNVNNLVKRTINPAERAILEERPAKYKRLILTRRTVEDPKQFDLE